MSGTFLDQIIERISQPPANSDAGLFEERPFIARIFGLLEDDPKTFTRDDIRLIYYGIGSSHSFVRRNTRVLFHLWVRATFTNLDENLIVETFFERAGFPLVS